MSVSLALSPSLSLVTLFNPRGLKEEKRRGMTRKRRQAYLSVLRPSCLVFTNLHGVSLLSELSSVASTLFFSAFNFTAQRSLIFNYVKSKLQVLDYIYIY